MSPLIFVASVAGGLGPDSELDDEPDNSIEAAAEVVKAIDVAERESG